VNPQNSNLIFIIAMVAIFYFMLIRPQQKKAKQQRDMLAALTPGMAIVTVGGIHGTIVEVDERIRIRVYDGSEIEIAKAAVGQMLGAEVVVDSSDEASQIEAEDE
jgi:preprotein translocase subunit YajC